jgi:GTP-binding protein
VSALTGEGVQELFPAIERIIDEYRKRIPTSVLNSAIEIAVRASPPPSSRGRRVRIYYSTQISSAPPNFVLFTNYPEAIPEAIAAISRHP